MTLMSFPRMVVSETEGWRDIVRMHPSALKMFLCFVVPLSLLPPLMYAYTQLVYPGVVFDLVKPPLSVSENLIVGSVFFLIELATVALMAAYIQQLGAIADVKPGFAAAYTMAAIAPAPLWLSALMLFVPNLWINMATVLAAWVASAALIRHGVRPLFKLDDPVKARRLANAITMTGVGTWVGMLLLLMMMLSMLLGWR